MERPKRGEVGNGMRTTTAELFKYSIKSTLACYEYFPVRSWSVEIWMSQSL